MVAHIVATEVLTELERVVAVRPGEVIDELVLRDVTALRECMGGIVRIREAKVVDARILVKDLSERERSQSRRPLRELRHVVAQR